MSRMFMRSGTILCMVMLISSPPRMTVADGENTGTCEEVNYYAHREAQTVGLEDFQGGYPNAVTASYSILLVLVVFYYVMMFFDGTL